MNILITGGNGYIAKSLANGLRFQHTITSITRQDFDLTDAYKTRAWLEGKHFDVVIHTAICGGSRLQKDSAAVLDNNLKMYYNLLDNRSSFDRFINIGSGAELYYINTPYGLSKHVIRQSLLNQDNFYNVRVFAVFDENELDTRFIKANLMRYIQKEPMKIHSNHRMDFFYMKDFVAVIDHYINDNSPQKEYDCTYAESLHLSDIADYINQLADYKVAVDIELSFSVNDYVGKSTAIDIDFVGLKSGIHESYEKLICKI